MSGILIENVRLFLILPQEKAISITHLRGAPKVEAALKTKAARKRVETENIIVEQTLSWVIVFRKAFGMSTSEKTLGATWHQRGMCDGSTAKESESIGSLLLYSFLVPWVVPWETKVFSADWASSFGLCIFYVTRTA